MCFAIHWFAGLKTFQTFILNQSYISFQNNNQRYYTTDNQKLLINIHPNDTNIYKVRTKIMSKVTRNIQRFENNCANIILNHTFVE